MRKILLIITMLSMVIMLTAQDLEGTPKIKKGESYHAIELDGLFNFSMHRFGGGVGIQEVYGRQLNPHLVLGGGVGFSYLDYKVVDKQDLELGKHDIDEFVFRLYFNLRYIVLADKKWSPMFMFSAGVLEILDVSQRSRGFNPVRVSYELGALASVFLGANARINDKCSLFGGVSYGVDVPMLTGFMLKMGVSF